MPTDRVPHLAIGALVVFSCLGCAGIVRAAESLDACTGTITALPAVVTTPGIWCVTGNLASAAAAGNAIDIQADRVTLDCNDFTLDGTGAGLATQARGIYALNRSQTRIRRCNVRGFHRAVSLSGGSGHLVEDNTFQGNTFQALNINASGGFGSTIRRNRVLDTGGSTISAPAFGIVTYGVADIRENIVMGVTARVGGNGSAYGIYDVNNTDGSIGGNHVTGLVKDGTGQALGIWNDNAGRVSIVGNRLSGNASANSKGVRCSSTSNRARDNLVSGFVLGLIGCGDAGGNDVTP